MVPQGAEPPRGGVVPDVLMFLIVVAFFALSLAFVALGEKLR